MTRIFVLFNLKPGVEKAAYEAWARTTDVPLVRKLPSIASFDVFEVMGLFASDAKPPYEYVEVVDVKDMDQFGHDIALEPPELAVAEHGAECVERVVGHHGPIVLRQRPLCEPPRPPPKCRPPVRDMALLKTCLTMTTRDGGFHRVQLQSCWNAYQTMAFA